MKKFKVIGVVMLVSLFGLFLTGCQQEEGPTKAELIGQINYLNSDVAWLEDELEKAQTSLDRATADLSRIQGILMEPERVIITELGDNTGRTSFSYDEDGSLAFPRELYVEGTTAIPNTARIVLGANVSIAPSGNWVTKVDGTTVHYSHATGIRGTTKIGASMANAGKREMEEALDIFFRDFATSTVVYSEIFISGSLRGIHARVQTLVEEEPHIIHAIVISHSKADLIGVFEFAQSNTREEFMIQLISTLAWDGTRIHLGN